MKPLLVLAAVLLWAWAPGAQAVEAYAAVDASPLAVWRQCTWGLICPGNSYDANSHGYGVRAGLWLPHESETDKTALEIGYDRLGATSGSKDYYLNPPCMIFCAGATATWRNEAALAYVDWSGRVAPGDRMAGGRWGRGALTGKIGLYHSVVTTTGNLGAGGPDYTRRVTANGLMLGAGYAYPLSSRWSAQAGADAFFNVKVAKPIDPGGTLSELVLRLWLGAGYDF